MEKPLKSDIVVLPFPFTDLSSTKKRPALVITSLKGDDLIVCQITGQIMNDDYVIEISDDDIFGGKLDGRSFVRINKIFTADKSIILYKIGSLKKQTMQNIEEKIIQLIRNN